MWQKYDIIYVFCIYLDKVVKTNKDNYPKILRNKFIKLLSICNMPYKRLMHHYWILLF